MVDDTTAPASVSLFAGTTTRPLTALLVQVAHLPTAVGALSALDLLAVVAGGVLALVAIVHHGKRSNFVFAILPLRLCVVLLVPSHTRGVLISHRVER